MIELIGWSGAILLSICGLPQAILSIKQKHSEGISWGLLNLWMTGEIFQLIYVIYLKNIPIALNCTANIIFLVVIIYYKIWPKE